MTDRVERPGGGRPADTGSSRARAVRDIVLRPAAESELDRLSELTEIVYGVRREPETLRWLLFHPAGRHDVESLVAERQGRVVGHMAMLRSRYRVDGRAVSGTHRMLWMVEEESRGAAGVPLAGRSPETDFEIVLGGTAATRAILVMRGFREVGEALEVRLLAASAAVSAARSNAATAGIALSGQRRGRRGARGHERGPATVTAPAASPGDEDILVNLAEPGRLAWLASCPEHDGLLFHLTRRGEFLGPVLLYVNRANDPPTGRVVHMPHLAEDAAGPALAAILDRLHREGCAEATVLSTEEGLLRAAESLGGAVFYRRPLWFRNPNGGIDPARFHLTYMEGDLAYRRV